MARRSRPVGSTCRWTSSTGGCCRWESGGSAAWSLGRPAPCVPAHGGPPAKMPVHPPPLVGGEPMFRAILDGRLRGGSCVAGESLHPRAGRSLKTEQRVTAASAVVNDRSDPPSAPFRCPRRAKNLLILPAARVRGRQAPHQGR